jgi:hypothetical protein
MHTRGTQLLAALMLTCFTPAVAQDANTKTVLLDRPMGNDPIRVVKVMDGPNELKSDGKTFPNHYVWEAVLEAGDDWVKDLSVVIRNVSTKKITNISVACNLLESADLSAEIAKHSSQANPVVGQASNVVGWRPEFALYSPFTGRKGKPDSERRPAFELLPGQEFTIAVENPENYEFLKSTVEHRQPIATVTACPIGIPHVFFADGTQWQGHRFMRPTDTPGHYTTISLNEWSEYKAADH